MQKKSARDSGLSSMETAVGSPDLVLPVENSPERRGHPEGIDSGNESDVESQTEDQEGHEPVPVNEIFGYDDDAQPATPQQEEDEVVIKEYRECREKILRERSARELVRERSRSKSGERLTPSGTPRRRRSPTREEALAERRRSKRDFELLREESSTAVAAAAAAAAERLTPTTPSHPHPHHPHHHHRRGRDRTSRYSSDDDGSPVLTRSGSQTQNSQTPNSSGSNSVDSQTHTHSGNGSQDHSAPREPAPPPPPPEGRTLSPMLKGNGADLEVPKMMLEGEELRASSSRDSEEQVATPTRRETSSETKLKAQGVSFALETNSRSRGTKRVRPGVSSGSDSSIPATAAAAGAPGALTPPTSVTPPLPGSKSPPFLSRRVSYSSPSTDFSAEEDEGASASTQRRNRRRRIMRKFWAKFGKIIVTHPSFPLSFMFSLLFLLETVMKFNGWSSSVQLFKTVVPYFMVSWCTIQATRLVYAINPDSVFPLFLSFVPFPLFVIFSREHHSSLATLWLLLALNMHIRSLKGAQASKSTVKFTLLLYVVLYLLCVGFMSFYFVDVSGVDRLYGHLLSAPITLTEELTSLLVSLVFTVAMFSQDVTHRARKLIGNAPTTPPISLRKTGSKEQLLQVDAHPTRKESSGSGILSSSSSLGSLKYTIPFESLVFSEQDILGRGASGIVYKGTLDQEPVAIKKLLRDNISSKEVKILSSLSHKYIIGFKGISTRGEHDLYIVTEYVPHGSIYDYLEKLRKEKKTLPLSLIKKWSLQIAIGMDYLHTGAPQKILHRDLKSRNVLLDSNLDVKIADFGWSRTTDDLATAMTNTVGTCAWMAPEVIRGAKYTEMVDVWSYGVVLWELVTGQIPYDGLNFNSILFGVGREPPLLFLPIPKTCPPAVTEILEKCWQRDSTLRPTFKTAIQMLEASNICQDTDSEFAHRQKEWRKEIARTMKSQERLMSSEVSAQDPRVLLEQITAKEQSVLLRTEEMNQQEARLRRRELILVAITIVLVLVLVVLAITTHKFSKVATMEKLKYL